MPFALSDAGVDLLVAMEEAMATAEMNEAQVRSVERLAVAVITPTVASLTWPPKGHDRWHEERWTGPVFVTRRVDLDQTRNKGWLRRIDYGRLLERSEQ